MQPSDSTHRSRINKAIAIAIDRTFDRLIDSRDTRGLMWVVVCVPGDGLLGPVQSLPQRYERLLTKQQSVEVLLE